MTGHTDARLALASARLLVPLSLKVYGALGFERCKLGLAPATASLLVEDFVVVAVGDGALAAAGAAMLGNLHAGAQVVSGRGVRADDDVKAGVADFLGLALAAGTLKAQT